MSIKVLDTSTIQSLHSGQVIVDLEAIVKELLENAIDANATTIDFTFMNNGLDYIQVKDNGSGIEEKDRACVAKCHYTSKISTFKDLEAVQTYGFRGEAMNSICLISDKFVITTKTKQDTVGKQYSIDKQGNVLDEKVVNTIPNSGTIVTLYKPFYDLPVRRQVAIKQGSNNMKKIQELLVKYALVHPNIRFSSQLANHHTPMWIKPITSSLESTMSILFGAALTDMLEHFLETDLQHPTLSVDVVLPKSNSDPSVILKGPDRVYVYVNDRPVNYIKSELRELITTIRNRYRDTIGLTENTSKKIPFIYINIKISPDEYDVNIEPNKTTILFHQKQLVYNLIQTQILDKIYPTKADAFFQSTKISTKPTQQKDWSFNMDDDEEIDELEEESDDNNIIKNKIVIPTTPADETMRVLTKKQQQQQQMTPIIHAVPPTMKNVSESIIPKKRHLQIEKDDEEETPKSTLSIRDLFMPTNKNFPVNKSARVHTPPSVVHSNQPQRIQTTLSKDTTPAVRLPATPINPLLDRRSPLPEPSLSPERSPLLDKRSPFIDKKSPLPESTRAPKQKNSLPEKRPITVPKFKSPQSAKQLCDTLNETMTIDCNLQEIKLNYPQRKEILSETYRIRIDEYLSVNDYDHPGQITNLIKFPLNSDLSFYTRGTPSTVDRNRHQIYQLGVVKLNALSTDTTLKKLIKEHQLVCKKKNLERPVVQIQMNHEDALCPTLISLKSKEQFIENDFHGQQKITYSEIIDPMIIHNGFKVRWRKDLYSGNLIIQFTSIYSLGNGYGPSDFRELLGLMMTSKPGEFVRPKKVMDYLKSMAGQISSHISLEEGLNNLVWKKENNREESDWEIGYGTNNKVLACKLTSSNSNSQT